MKKLRLATLGLFAFAGMVTYGIDLDAKTKKESVDLSSDEAVDAAIYEDPVERQKFEIDRRRPIDYGFGPGVKKAKTKTKKDKSKKENLKEATLAPMAVSAFAVSALSAADSWPEIPPGGNAAHNQGVFGAPAPWPIIGLHALLLQDFRVLSYGTDERGRQGGFVYDLWDPRLGTVEESHTTLPIGTSTDLFCSAQSLMWGTGEALLTGGDVTIDGKRNYSSNGVTIFDPVTDTLRDEAPMEYPRWYPTIVPMPDGEMIVVGGRSDVAVPVITPEAYRPGGGWRTLNGASSAPVFKIQGGWYYTRAFLAPNGKVFIVGFDGKFFELDPTGAGSITTLPGRTLQGRITLPTVMFAPGKLLSIRLDRKVVVVDINGAAPVATETADIDQDRHWSMATVMADGRVLVNGGSTDPNKVVDPALRATIWNPNNGQWTPAAAAQKYRLYHSASLLLPDATVLTMGGGAPGPVRQLNAEIFYPPYLYDNAGAPKPRPEILGVSPSTALPGQTLTISVPEGTNVSKVALMRFGSATHSSNFDQRYFPYNGGQLTKNGQNVEVVLDGNVNVMQPGVYMVFVFDGDGTPSIAKMFRVLKG